MTYNEDKLWNSEKNYSGKRNIFKSYLFICICVSLHYSADANFYCWCRKYPTLLGLSCTCGFPLVCLGFWLADFTYGFWKYLVCSAGSFGVYFCDEKLLQFPHLCSRILIFLIKITHYKNSDNSYTKGCGWKLSCVYLQESITFCLICIHTKFGQSSQDIRESFCHDVHIKTSANSFPALSRLTKFHIRWV